MKPLLILGKGFIGSNLSDFLDQQNVTHEIYSNSMLDYTNKDTLDKFLKEVGEKFYCVINTSGYTGSPNVDGCESNKQECWKRNVTYVKNIVDVANSHKLPVLQIGSGCIYNGYEKEYTEDDEPNFGLYSNDSSFYSKCKHASEIILDETCVYILRIRIPFTYKNVSKNYLAKLLKYDNLISEKNSVTSVTDLNDFIFRFLYLIRDLPGGIYNVVNPQPVTAEDVVELMKSVGVVNPNWNFIPVDKLQTKAKRSNCVLSTKKIEKFHLEMPDTVKSLTRDINIFKQMI
jgi:dTDP-4-dehydrorhamnose reductase